MKNPIKAHILRKSEKTILVGTANAIILFNKRTEPTLTGHKKKPNKERRDTEGL